MFGPRIIRPQKIEVDIDHKTEVVEKRAPTDESVRLLDEMHRAAEDRLVCAIACNSNRFSFVAHVFDEPHAFRHKLRVRFTLGETCHDLDVELERHMLSKEEYIKVIYDILSKRIAEKILASALPDLIKIRVIR
jgi:hypothetical protein